MDFFVEFDLEEQIEIIENLLIVEEEIAQENENR